MNYANQTVLCIGDSHSSYESVTIMLKQLGYQVISYSTAEEGLRYARKRKLRAIMLDNRLKNSKRVEICRKVRSFDVVTPIIFFSSRRSGNLINKRGGKDIPVQI